MSLDKTIMVLAPGFPKDESDSTCLPMQQQLVRAIKKNKPDIEVIVLSFQYPYDNQPYQWHGITVIPFNGRNKGGLQRLINRHKILSVLKELHRKRPIAGLLSFWYGECAAVGKIFADRNSIHHYCWVLGQDVRKHNKYPARTRLRPGELIAVSDATCAEFEKNHGVQPAHVIPPGIETGMFDKTVKERTIDILGAGSLIPLKNYEVFVLVVAAARASMPELKAEIIGKGPEYKKLSDLIIKHGLQDNITLAGELPYSDVLDRMQRSKIFLHPSITEGFSGVCMEALYAGAHVISLCKPMNRDIEQWHIADSTGEMIYQTNEMLHKNSRMNKSVLYHSMDEVAGKMLKLFF